MEEKCSVRKKATVVIGTLEICIHFNSWVYLCTPDGRNTSFRFCVQILVLICFCKAVYLLFVMGLKYFAVTVHMSTLVIRTSRQMKSFSLLHTKTVVSCVIMLRTLRSLNRRLKSCSGSAHCWPLGCMRVVSSLQNLDGHLVTCGLFTFKYVMSSSSRKRTNSCLGHSCPS